MKLQSFVSLRFSLVASDDKIVDDYLRLYNNTFNCTYNEIVRRNDNLSTVNANVFQKTMNSVLEESVIRQAAYLDAQEVFKKSERKPNVVFDGKRFFGQRQKRLIKHDEFI
jgi:di/tripeptidase